MRRISFSIIQFHLGNKVAATPGPVHGSICLILKTERKKDNNHDLYLALTLETVQMFTLLINSKPGYATGLLKLRSLQQILWSPKRYLLMSL